MTLILKFCLAAMLAAFLAVPALAEKHHGGGTTLPAESYKEPQAQPSAAERSGTQTRKPIPPPGLKGEATAPSGIKGESQDDKHKDWRYAPADR
jgi:hypothetical protein